MCFWKSIADRFSSGRRMEEKWKTTHGKADQKDRNNPPGRHLQQVHVLRLFLVYELDFGHLHLEVTPWFESSLTLMIDLV